MHRKNDTSIFVIDRKSKYKNVFLFFFSLSPQLYAEAAMMPLSVGDAGALRHCLSHHKLELMMTVNNLFS